jgi:hypothetical protein
MHSENAPAAIKRNSYFKARDPLLVMSKEEQLELFIQSLSGTYQWRKLSS